MYLINKRKLKTFFLKIKKSHILINLDLKNNQRI